MNTKKCTFIKAILFFLSCVCGIPMDADANGIVSIIQLLNFDSLAMRSQCNTAAIISINHFTFHGKIEL